MIERAPRIRGEPQVGEDGWRSSDTAELSFTDARVPVQNLVGPENTGFLQIAAAFVAERIGLAVQAYSGAQRCLDLTVQWCRDRQTLADR